MKKWALILIPVMVVLVGGSVYGAEMNLKDGLWEITAKIEMAGMPGGSMPAQKVTQCITKKDAVPQKGDSDKEMECKTTSTKVVGDTVNWSMKCQGKDGTTMDSQGSATYKGDKFDGVTHMTMAQPGQKPMKMTQRMSGRRIGECK